FQMVRSLSGDVYLVQISDAVSPDLLKQLVKDDPDVKNLELDGTARVPEATWQYRPGPAFSYSAVTQKPISDYNLTQLYGQRTWVGYVQQPALAVIESSSGRDYTDIFSYGCDKSTSAGIVAVIDTGVDPDQPLLRSVLIPGYDFTRGIAGRASEMSDLSQSTAAILEQEARPGATLRRMGARRKPRGPPRRPLRRVWRERHPEGPALSRCLEQRGGCGVHDIRCSSLRFLDQRGGPGHSGSAGRSPGH